MQRILLSGPGLIGKKHAEIVHASDDAELVGIVAPDTPENRTFAKEQNVPLYSDFSTALVKTRPTAAIVSSPNNFHFEQVKQALMANVPTLVEKPLTEDPVSSRRLAEIVAETQVPLLVGHHRTHSPLVLTAKSFLQSPDFGRLVAFQGSALFYKPEEYFATAPWRSQTGGGPLLINLIHEIGLWRIFCGELRTINAIVSNKQRSFVVEDSATISMQFENDAVGSFILSDAASSAKSWELSAGENPMFPNYPEETCYHFAGTQGSLDFPNMSTKSYKKTRSWTHPFESETLATQRQDPLVLQFNHFMRVVKGTEAPLVSALDGYRNIEVLAAIRLAATTGRSVNLRDDQIYLQD